MERRSPTSSPAGRVAGRPRRGRAAELLGLDDTTSPPELMIPGLVVALFLGDVTSDARDGEPPVPSGWRRPDGRPGGTQRDTLCADVAAYLAASLEDVLDPGRQLEPQWLQAAIDLYTPWETDAQRIRTSIGAIA